MPRAPLASALIAIAAVNLAVGVWLSAQPDRLADFTTVSDWVRLWLSGRNVYAPPSGVDYPPWALVLLSPLGVIPVEVRAPLWIALNTALAVTLAVHLARLTGEPKSFHVRLAALFLTAAAFRTLNQFSLMSLTIALAGATIHWRFLGGLILGVGLMKPQIGGPVALWVLLSGDPRRFLVALAVPLILTMFYAEPLGTTAVTVLVDYARALQIYVSSTTFTGHTEIKPWLLAIWPGAPAGFWLLGGLIVVLLSPALAAIARRRRPLDRDLELLAFCGLVSLLAMRHLTYDLVLVLPVLAAWRPPPLGSDPRPRWMTVMVVVAAAWLVLDFSGIGRRVLQPIAPAVLTAVAIQMDRILCLTLWGVLGWRLWTRAGPS